MEVDENQSPIREAKKAMSEVSTPVSTCQDMVMETPNTPLTPATDCNVTDFNDDDLDESEADLSNTSITTEKAFQVSSKGVHATPGPIKARRQMEEKMLHSPSDAMLSPCTTMLMGRGSKKTISGPAAALRKKQVGSIPFKLNDE